MENVIELPEIVPLYYKGKKVLTTIQITGLLDCTRQVVTGAFRYNRLKFEEGVDYFYLNGGTLRDFKAEIAGKKNCSPAGKNLCPPFSNLASSLYLWTESGVLKLSKYIDTDKAKIIYSTLALGYFKAEETPLPTSEGTSIKVPRPTSAEKFERLKFLIEHCTDSVLRDELIRKAAELI